MNIDERYMQRCLQLAAMADGHTSPNPMVGAVVVCNGKIIGEGYHRQCGGPHAEVNAIASVRNKSLLRQSTIYVSLEPCSHHGKTPPCCDLIIASGIPRVVVGCLDPFPQVSGRGVKRLQENGIEVITNVLQEECWWLNRKFMTYHGKGRPYVTLKWAQSSDHYIDRVRAPHESPTLFSTTTTRIWAHKLRATNDAIMVGTNTVITDNPSLTTRYWSGKNPIRITIDRHHRIPAQAAILDGTTPTIVIGKDYISDPLSSCSGYTPQDILSYLSSQNIHSIIIEGGSELLQSFIDSNLWDEAHIETTAITLHKGIAAPCIKGKEMQKLTHCHNHYTSILINC
ncbi:MAG: bifunctional diaminohydroxyphosphoribosylaminopyrimidine deaminase/5-amino-6-(5-phosphoribosylamino)uracil reductase RibD [Bacteroidaceae bacterium]|nr:bifunctional diaminohydroxyphosphoribosylaminopyrimidine deaminase/5-amino-6-(5-phosphoribosylamino)uracil reductase RibD [Bacteroidales bacterium]MBP3671005.1 bifunctional diaminohydroxyphosphoribosylaminopyrimidine deaminase/5-amino-6-(5-phosphoribosylamino)uracil reductase RibD [Bacteroidaceae bacterium]MBQ2979330.1 bifunctional diaminohydroxyphosphoribosylaminopyrimidine deaminase/5-amino-6-(5-phosphoribosylamino)uracil reductase RibD [Bacteroidaceae bacterium]